MDLIFTFYPVAITLPTNPFVLPIPLLIVCTSVTELLYQFVKHGDPNFERRRGTIEWHLFGEEKRIVDTTLLGFWRVNDHQLPEDEGRFWQSPIYFIVSLQSSHSAKGGAITVGVIAVGITRFAWNCRSDEYKLSLNHAIPCYIIR